MQSITVVEGVQDDVISHCHPGQSFGVTGIELDDCIRFVLRLEIAALWKKQVVCSIEGKQYMVKGEQIHMVWDQEDTQIGSKQTDGCH